MTNKLPNWVEVRHDLDQILADQEKEVIRAYLLTEDEAKEAPGASTTAIIQTQNAITFDSLKQIMGILKTPKPAKIWVVDRPDLYRWLCDVLRREVPQAAWTRHAESLINEDGTLDQRVFVPPPAASLPIVPWDTALTDDQRAAEEQWCEDYEVHLPFFIKKRLPGIWLELTDGSYRRLFQVENELKGVSND